MKKDLLFAGVLFLTMLLIASQSLAQDYRVFLWQHDNGDRANDPVLQQANTACDAIALTLTQLEIDYTRDVSLPDLDDLLEYDIVIVALGWYIPG